MKIGDLVKFETKYEGVKLGLIVDEHWSDLGMDWVVKPIEGTRNVICSHIDLEVVSEG